MKVEFELNGKKEWVEFKKLTFGEYNDLMKECIKMKAEGTGEMKMDIDFAKYRELLILKSIKQTSDGFKASIDFIRSLPREVGELLFNKAQEVNPF